MVCQVKNVLKGKLHPSWLSLSLGRSSGEEEELTSVCLENITHGKWNM